MTTIAESNATGACSAQRFAAQSRRGHSPARIEADLGVTLPTVSERESSRRAAIPRGSSPTRELLAEI